MGQGTRMNQADEIWTILPTSVIYLFVGRDDDFYLNYGLEGTNINLPHNIISRKNKYKNY